MKYSVKKADLKKDKEVIIRFWNDNHDQNKALDAKFAWIYEGNPDGAAHVWMLIHEDENEVVGLASVFYKGVLVGEVPYKAGIGGDFFVRKEHRSLGPALMLVDTIAKSEEIEDIDFLYAFPNDAARLIFRRVGYKKLGSLVGRVRVFQTKKYLVKKGVPESLAGIICPITDYLMKAISPETWDFNFGRYHYKVIDELGSDYDELRSGLNIYKSVVVPKKSLDYMNWKYGLDPDQKNEFFCLYKREDDSLVGCVAFSVSDGFAEIRDLVVNDEYPTLNDLIHRFLEYSRKLDVRGVRYVLLENSRIEKDLSRFDFFPQKNRRDVVVLVKNKELLTNEVSILDRKRWIFFNTDQDT
ncbi:MAG: GNAT family N-acetyltransferase [Gammaproteobacteria bacterium (ex Lamellibrachia satsuma)]|nr:MAG: GNAT family N-acetyltransferase [Gammaproteobacteria bacterium (ex Lamellibrachia satsuma)]